MMRPRLVAAAVGLMLALPGGVLAQSAGDEQYGDPFADEPKSQSNGGGNGSRPATTPVQGNQGGSAGSTGVGNVEDQGATAGSTGVGELPASGFDAGPLAALGAALLLAGAALRSRTAPAALPPAYLMGGGLDRRPRRRRHLRFGR